jgi:hypothetical protein
VRFSPSNNFSFQAMRSIKEEEEAFQLAPACKCRRDEDILSSFPFGFAISQGLASFRKESEGVLALLSTTFRKSDAFQSLRWKDETSSRRVFLIKSWTEGQVFVSCLL